MKLGVFFGLLIVVMIGTSSGMSLKLHLRYKAVPLGDQNILVCNVTDAWQFQDIILFYREKTLMGKIRYIGGYCISGFMYVDGYKKFCEKGTNSFSARTKSFLLIIKHFHKVDVKNWHCSLERGKLTSNTVKPRLLFYEPSLSQHPKPIPLNSPFSLTCSVKYAHYMNDTVTFYRKHKLVASVYQNLTKCSKFHVDDKRSYALKCLGQSSLNYAKSFRLLIKVSHPRDETNWYCQVAGYAKRSNIISVHFEKLAVYMNASHRVEVERKRVYIYCIVTNAIKLSDEIIFYKDDNSFGSLVQELKDCYPYDEPKHAYKLVCPKHRRTTRVYTLEIRRARVSDSGVWTCEISDHGLMSNKLKLEIKKRHRRPLSMNAVLDTQALKSDKSENEHLTDPYIVTSVVILGITSVVLIVALTFYIRHKRKLGMESSTQIIDKKNENNATGYKNPTFEGVQT